MGMTESRGREEGAGEGKREQEKGGGSRRREEGARGGRRGSQAVGGGRLVGVAEGVVGRMRNCTFGLGQSLG